jgi:hypothetical protein
MGVAFPDTSRVAYNRSMASRRINDPIGPMTLGRRASTARRQSWERR